MSQYVIDKCFRWLLYHQISLSNTFYCSSSDLSEEQGLFCNKYLGDILWCVTPRASQAGVALGFKIRGGRWPL